MIRAGLVIAARAAAPPVGSCGRGGVRGWAQGQPRLTKKTSRAAGGSAVDRMAREWPKFYDKINLIETSCGGRSTRKSRRMTPRPRNFSFAMAKLDWPISLSTARRNGDRVSPAKVRQVVLWKSKTGAIRAH